MRKHYDFSNSIPNPYTQRGKKQITTRLDEDTIEYSRVWLREKGILYQSLINLYLRELAQANRDLKLEWQ